MGLLNAKNLKLCLICTEFVNCYCLCSCISSKFKERIPHFRFIHIEVLLQCHNLNDHLGAPQNFLLLNGICAFQNSISSFIICQCVSNLNVHLNHLGILLPCRLGLGRAQESVFPTSLRVVLILLIRDRSEQQKFILYVCSTAFHIIVNSQRTVTKC